jgi:hypothetical protein
LLGNFIKQHYINVGCGPRLPKIVSLLQKDLHDSNVVIQQKAAKAFEQIAVPLGSEGNDRTFRHSFTFFMILNDVNFADATFRCSVDCHEIWLTMLQGPLVPMLQSTSGILASAAADCIANITATVFEQLPVCSNIVIIIFNSFRIILMGVLCFCFRRSD